MTTILCATYGQAALCRAWFRRRDIFARQDSHEVHVDFDRRRNGSAREREFSPGRRYDLIHRARQRYATPLMDVRRDTGVPDTEPSIQFSGDDDHGKMWREGAGDTGIAILGPGRDAVVVKDGRIVSRPDDGRTHTFMAKVGDHGDLYAIQPVILCHNDPADVHRDCKFAITDADPDCEHRGGEKPLPCGGWDFDGQHLHPDEGCGVQWSIDEVGLDIVAPTGSLIATQGFTVSFTEGCPLLHPVS